MDLLMSLLSTGFCQQPNIALERFFLLLAAKIFVAGTGDQIEVMYSSQQSLQKMVQMIVSNGPVNSAVNCSCMMIFFIC